MAGKLTAREQRFCLYYSWLGNVREAAVRAGYPADEAEERGLKLLARRDSCDQPETFDELESKSLRGDALRGLRRLAFGSVADPVAIALSDPPETSNLQHLDLYMVSEIKRPKGGGFEIKFYDRIKALEALAHLTESGSSGSGDGSFLAALEKSVETQVEGEQNGL